jgi:putative ATPase
MRPQSIDEFVGQAHLLGPGQILRGLLEQRALRSLILWGPPGTGKTTLARLYAQAIGASFHPISAVMAGVKEVREAIEGARLRAMAEGTPTLVFVDEIHRFNKAQQDALLPHVEGGVVTLVGATTENPSFEVNGALLSRCRVLQLAPLSDADLSALIHRSLEDVERGLGPTAPDLEPDAEAVILDGASGDARAALNTLEVAADLASAAAPVGERGVITRAIAEEAQQKKTILYDKDGDQHYQVVSAFIKSMRGSDPDAALFYMVKMLEAGEDPRFVLRRMVIFASEDIGNADPHALQVAVSALQAYDLMGMPEGSLPMTQAATYLATAPKSNAVIMAYGRARKDVLAHPNLSVPKHLINASSSLGKAMGHGRGYKYPHNFDGNYVPERYLPDRIRGHVYYEPSRNGYEATIADRLEAWRASQGEDEDDG